MLRMNKKQVRPAGQFVARLLPPDFLEAFFSFFFLHLIFFFFKKNVGASIAARFLVTFLLFHFFSRLGRYLPWRPPLFFLPLIFFHFSIFDFKKMFFFHVFCGWDFFIFF